MRIRQLDQGKSRIGLDCFAAFTPSEDFDGGTGPTEA